MLPKESPVITDPKQFVIDFGDSPEVVDAAEGIADAALEMVGGYERRKPGTEKPRSEALPAHLPRSEVKLPVPADLKDCPTHGEREVIGFDWQETLEIVPPKLIVRRTGIPMLAFSASGRKNSMLIGSIDAGNRAADLMTLVSSAVRNELDVFLCLKDVHEKLLGGRHDFEGMRPDVWKLTHPENANLSPQRTAAPRRG